MLTPNPEFALSFCKPGPVNQSISNGFFKQGNVEHGLNSRISVRSCGAQDVSGHIVQVPFWCDNLFQTKEQALPNIADNTQDEVQAAHLHDQETFLSPRHFV